MKHLLGRSAALQAGHGEGPSREALEAAQARALGALVAALLGLALFAPKFAAAQILTGVSFEQLTLSGGDEPSSSTAGLVADIAAGIPLADESLLGLLGLRVGADEYGDPRLATQVFMRVSSGLDPWKTFFDAGLLARLIPSWSAGARVGIGLQYDLSEHAGLFVTAGGSAGFGERFHVGFDGGVGMQFRFGGTGAPSRVHWYEH